MPAKYVKAFLKGNKNDFRDAEAVAEAVQRPTMRFVATKTAEQLDLQGLHRVRARLVSERTATVNEIRAFLGIAVAQGIRRFRRALPESLEPTPAGCRRAWPASSRPWPWIGAASISASTRSRPKSRRWPARTRAANG
jgi:transposase